MPLQQILQGEIALLKSREKTPTRLAKIKRIERALAVMAKPVEKPAAKPAPLPLPKRKVKKMITETKEVEVDE